MSYAMQKPENALKRARELMHIPNVDDAVLKRSKRNALEILHEALVAKKFRTWQPLHEELMKLYLDICLEQQLGRIAKDGLHQYRNLSIATNPASLETIIAYFVAQTNERLATAKHQSNALILEAAAAVDLEAAQTPEAVMLSTTSFDSSSDRTDREVVVPWLRFAWETYRTVLDILKNNSKLETLYKTVTLQAMDFCVEYNRKIEFRRLGEILRNHLGALQKHTSAPTSQSARQMRAWDGFTIDSVEKLLEVRYRQLQVATELELFSEAFRTIDDINNVMNLVDQVPRLELMVTYYDKLAQIFLVSKNFLFHAFALYKLYALRVGGLRGLDGALALKNVKSLLAHDDQHALATRVVLAALSVPLVDFETSTPELENAADAETPASAQSSAVREKNARMAALLGYATTPSRAQLLDEIEQAGILAKASPAVASIFQHVERDEVDPLQIVAQITPSLATLRATPAASYVDAIERLVVRRVLFQLTRVYSSVTIAHLKSILSGLDVSYQEIEQLIVRSRSLSTVAHASAPSLTSLYQSKTSSVESSTAAATAAALRTKIRIDHVQQCIRFSDAVELEANPAQLSVLGDRLARVLRKVSDASATEAKARTARFASTRATLDATRAAMVARREIIERKKEELEQLQQEKLKSLEKKRQEYEATRLQMEKERLEAEAKRREAEKKQKIKDEIALKETKQMLDKLGRKDLDNIDLENIDRDALLNEAKEKAQKAKEDAQRKLRDSARRLDYIIRATREAEQPIIQKQAADAKAAAKLAYEQEQKEQLETAQKQHEFALQEKKRLATALPVAATFVAGHVARRKALFQKTAEEQQKKALLARLEKRVAHAKARFEDEQQRIRDEQEEQERIRREEEEARERARQEEIDAEIRRQEQEEEEEKRRQEAEEKAAKEAERERESQPTSGLGRFAAANREREGGAYRPPSRRSDAGDEGGDWKSVGPRGGASEGRWERAGPPSRGGDDRFGSRFGGDRDGPREGGLRRGFGSDRDREGGDRFGDRRSFGGDREGREGGSGLRRAFGGDRDGDRDSGSFRRPFGGDRDGGDRDGPREGGLRRGFGGDRDGGDREGGGLRRAFGGDRDGGDREGGGLRRGFGGDRDREGGDRFGARRDGDRDGREGGAYRPPRGDREQARAPDSGRWR